MGEKEEDIKLTVDQKRVLLALYDPVEKNHPALKLDEIAIKLDMPLSEVLSVLTFLQAVGFVEEKKCEKSSRAA